ncbi:Mpv17/PMP22 family protein [Phlyctema vagabunda]|uniref:Mpv17/PMP22 family protein n=1 Tax=Phlyctema vagabunda TaxID=108571 RepID=A0ABR4PG71_9HELO
MPSPIVATTIQACILSAASNLIAQFITTYKSNAPFSIDVTPVLQFVIYTVLNAPPNFLWQSFLESAFPSTYVTPSPSAIAAAATNNEKELDKEEKTHELLETKLHIRNTTIKFLLDQTVGAAINTLLFSLVFAGFKGANTEQAVQIAKQDFWPMMSAGWRLWPAVSAINYTLVSTIEGRSLVGSLAGIGWSVYLSLIAGGK